MAKGNSFMQPVQPFQYSFPLFAYQRVGGGAWYRGTGTEFVSADFSRQNLDQAFSGAALCSKSVGHRLLVV